ncbi:MAG: hypothetical protein J6U20_03925 [Fibrobacter sp.]|nr:hypothetical protein [Fibrobacter sp.]
MKPKQKQIKEYRKMAKSSPNSMAAKIRSVLEKTCDKFAGHEDRLGDSLAYLTECARQILDGKIGEVDDETCYRICRDYFNDELWRNEEKPAKTAPVADSDEDGETDASEPETPAGAKESPTAAKPKQVQLSLFDNPEPCNA